MYCTVCTCTCMFLCTCTCMFLCTCTYVMYMSTLLNWYIIFSSWKPNCWIELQYVRHPPKQLEELDLTPGSKVEVCVCVCVCVYMYVIMCSCVHDSCKI